MSKKEKLTQVIDPELKFEFIEDSNEVDGEHILAKVKGVFFCPNGKSRNNRYYPKQLWEKVINDKNVKSKLKSRTMFGTVGHQTEINDRAVEEGKVSHIVTDAYIDENNKGIGEALILNTPSGKILNTLLRAGSNVFVSSRAEGRFKNEKKHGMPIVDEGSFNLIGWDFVLNPGFVEANPSLAEAAEELKNIQNIEGETTMNEETMDKLIRENVELRKKLETTLSENKNVDESVKAIEEENAHVKEQLAVAEDKIKEIEESNEEMRSVLLEAKYAIEDYEELTDSPEELRESLEKSYDYISRLHENIGTYDEIEEALTVAENYNKEVSEIGSISDIKRVMEIADKLVDDKNESIRQERIEDLAKENEVAESLIERLVDKDYSDEEIVEFVNDMKESFGNSKESYRRTGNDEVIVDEDEVEEAPKSKSRLARLMEDFNR